MEDKKLSFSSFEIYVDNIEFSKDMLQEVSEVFPIKIITPINDAKCIKYYADFRNDRYIFISVNEGKFLPPSTTIFNRELNKELPNTRTKFEAEWDKQTYAVYDFSKKILFMIDVRKKYLFEDFIKSNIFKNKDKSILIANIYKNEEDFLKEITAGDKILFARKRDAQANLFDEIEEFDPKWASGSESFSVELRYKNLSAFKNICRQFTSV